MNAKKDDFSKVPFAVHSSVLDYRSYQPADFESKDSQDIVRHLTLADARKMLKQCQEIENSEDLRESSPRPISKIEKIYKVFLAGKESYQCPLFPPEIYQKLRSFYYKFRPTNDMDFVYYLQCVRNSIGFRPDPHRYMSDFTHSLEKDIEMFGIMMIPISAVTSDLNLNDFTDSYRSKFLAIVGNRFLRQLSLDLLYKNNVNFEPDHDLYQEIQNLYASIQSEKLETNFIFLERLQQPDRPFIPDVTEFEYKFAVALGTSIDCSRKNTICNKLIKIISHCVFGQTAGSLKKISKYIFDRIENEPDSSSLNHELAAYFLMEYLKEGFWLACTSPYTAFTFYLAAPSWFSIASRNLSEKVNKPRVDCSEDKRPKYSLTKALMGLSGYALSELQPADYLLAPLVSQIPDLEDLTEFEETIRELIDIDGLDCETSELDAYKMAVRLLLTSRKKMTNRLEACIYELPDADLSIIEKNRMLEEENMKLNQRIHCLSDQISLLKENNNLALDKAFKRGQKISLSDLHPELNQLKQQLAILETENKKLKSEQDELFKLRELIFNEESLSDSHDIGNHLTAAEEEEIRCFLTTHKIVFIGGHIRQNRELENKYGSLSFLPNQTFPPESVSSANLVIIFANWVSHSTYYKAIGIAKRKGIPVDYINFRNLVHSERELLNIVRKYA